MSTGLILNTIVHFRFLFSEYVDILLMCLSARSTLTLSCFVFVVSVSGVAIVSPSINGYSDLDFILYDFVAETAGSFSGDFSGYPISDCYKSYEEAEAALQGEQEEKQ